MADERNGGGETRTALAEDRTIMANERTFAGWMRSSLACIAIALGFHALFAKVEPAWVPRSIATGFLVLAIMVMVLAEQRSAAVMRRLEAHVVKAGAPIRFRLIAAIIVAGALSLIAVIWLLRFD